MTREEILEIAKPVLFNTDMVRAILESRKSETRRLVKFIGGRNPNWTGYVKDGLMLYNGTNEPCIKPPRYKLGDHLYVRETWCWCPCWDCGMDTEEHNCCDGSASRIYNTMKREYGCYCYRASCEDDEFPDVDTWHSSIFMPKEAARIFLRVTDVRVERMQDITEEQAEKEGCINNYGFIHSPDNEYSSIHTAREQFINIWNSTIPKKDLDKYGWEANPWVWVIQFERVEVLDESGTGSQKRIFTRL